MKIEIAETLLASKQASALRGPARKAYEAFLDDLSVRGCAALAYRLTGSEPLPRLCVKHLRGRDRVVVAFESNRFAWVLLVGPHEDSDPARNVYDRLYALAEVQPPDNAKRTKPSCCDSNTGKAPLTNADIVMDLVQRARALAKETRRH